MLHFEVGKPLPLKIKPPGFEMVHTTVNSAFFDIIYWVRPESKVELESIVQTWTKAKIRYGVFSVTTIPVPFFLIEFVAKDFNFDCSLNVHKVQDDKVEEWLNSKGNIINLYLCDCRTGIIYGMRMISIEHALADQIRDLMERQDDVYADGMMVDVAMKKVMDSYTTVDMIKSTKMYNL